ncbi:MAG: 2-amino-4-hydroxy-6-hydroxymethyldihydropteridine diphosphokinase, partial [Bradyrhizobiaceae bacterium]|nr:2-amino-4-hydroxy-6-hydroxymethyldihydropteridine diphosphokinase [Bradyrhizobiaceae bacterium]
EADFALPHPHALERAFVLMPLDEIAPDRTIGGVTVREALARLDITGVERLPPR